MADYQIGFSWRSAYGHAVNLVRNLHNGGGVVVDLGCGYGAIAEPLAEAGFDYVGVDLDPGGVRDLGSRGFAAAVVDLTDASATRRTVEDLLAGRRAVAVTMLDALEHLPDTPAALEGLHDLVRGLGLPTLVLSVPNVTHLDIAAKLLVGRWDTTGTGLLDATHVQLFSGQRLTDELAAFGWVEIARDDFRLAVSDQHFPADPVLSPDTPLGQLVRMVRDERDDTGTVNQFVRAYAATHSRPGGARPAVETTAPFLSVVVRTQGNRAAMLADALTCLAAQTDLDFEVVLTVHADDPDVAERVTAQVLTFDETFAGRVRVVPVLGGGRSRPLNAGLVAARGQYIAFLDDDDLVTADWVEQFHAAADGARIVRARAVDRRVVAATGPLVDWEAAGPPELNYDARFDLLTHLERNQTPIHTFAAPREVVEAMHLRFDESMPVVEDWDFLTRLSRYTGVLDTGAVTAIYHQWDDPGGSRQSVGRDVWHATHRAALVRYDADPLLLPRASLLRLIDGRSAEEKEQFDDLRRQLVAAHERLAAIEASEWWRLTRPLRRAGTGLRRLGRLGRRAR
ncbi:MAG: methyltransferase domain-containing protein [Acidimicrobiia bacterium]|nr:methyltransferase domain-containing protein [Acidimicrobiia bacterium]